MARSGLTAQRVERRLAAILAADVAGYSRLMQADEEGTLAALKRRLRDAFDPNVAAHGGRIVKATGDGLLIEYPSVLEAVRSAVAIQREMANLNAGASAADRMAFRIGINLGDVILEGDDIFGDGVNVAARIEALAEPGGITISDSVHAQVRNRLDLGFTDLGHKRVKNIAEPIHVFRVDLSPAVTAHWRAIVQKGVQQYWVAASIAIALAAGTIGLWGANELWLRTDRDTSATASASFPLPEKPSIAVLPFADLGGVEQANLGGSITENVIAALSKVPGLFVIARDSTVPYGDSSAETDRIAEELGVRYVLEGSVQGSDGRVRTRSRLIDALSGRLVWSERYDRELADVFALQDDITLNVVTALQIELTDGELARVRQRGTDNLEAWLLVNQSSDAHMRFTREDNERAREFAERAIELDPSYPDAYVRLARCYLADFQTGWAADREAALLRSVELVQQALELDRDYPDAYVLLGAIHLFLRRHDDAIAYGEKAVSLSPNHSLAKASLAMILNYSGEPERAITSVREAMRLSPHYPDWFAGELGRGLVLTRRYDEAVQALKLRLERNPTSSEAQILLAAAYAAAGREEEARAALSTFLAERPSYTVEHYAAGEFYRDRADLNRFLDALRKAGLPG